MNKAERFAKLNKIEQHSFSNSTFSDAKSILEVMMKREDWFDFITSLYGQYSVDMIHLDYVLNPGKLLVRANDLCDKNK